MTSFTDDDSAHSNDAPHARAHPAVRIAAGVGGLLLFAGATVITLGMAVVAAIGALGTYWVQRRRGRRLTRLGSWLAASISAAVIMAAITGVMFTQMPEGTLSEAIAAAESAEAPPQPEWLRRIAPPPDSSSVSARIAESKPFYVYFAVLGASLMFVIFGSLAGTLGWTAVLLLGFAARGYWPFRGPRPDPLTEPY